MSCRISDDECARMHDLRNDGANYEQIAAAIGCSESAVGYHCRDNCRHFENHVDVNHASVEFQLVRLSDSLQRTPTKTDWDDAKLTVYSADTLVRIYGSWAAALDAAGLPVVPSNASKRIRAHAYRAAAPITMSEGSD